MLRFCGNNHTSILRQPSCNTDLVHLSSCSDAAHDFVPLLSVTGSFSHSSRSRSLRLFPIDAYNGLVDLRKRFTWYNDRQITITASKSIILQWRRRQEYHRVAREGLGQETLEAEATSRTMFDGVLKISPPSSLPQDCGSDCICMPRNLESYEESHVFQQISLG